MRGCIRRAQQTAGNELAGLDLDEADGELPPPRPKPEPKKEE